MAKSTINKIVKLLEEYFKDEPGKVGLWLATPNPLLGDAKPINMIWQGREKKLLKFIENQLDGETP